MPFAKGNQHARKKREFEGAIRKLIAQEKPDALRDIARKVTELALDGERWAVEMLRDTLDGRPATNIVATDDEGRELNIALIAYGKPDNDSAPVQAPALPATSPGGPGLRH